MQEISKETARRFVLGQQGLWPGRRWGYYTMPVLYGDRLGARLDPKLDRKTGRLSLQGFWLDDENLAGDAAFAQALASGLRNFARFHQATVVDTSVVNYPVLQAASLDELSVQERLSDAPRAGRKATFSPEQVCKMTALACEKPQEQSGRPISQWSNREIAAEVKRNLAGDLSQKAA